jgi:hypothetical protein
MIDPERVQHVAGAYVTLFRAGRLDTVLFGMRADRERDPGTLREVLRAMRRMMQPNEIMELQVWISFDAAEPQGNA